MNAVRKKNEYHAIYFFNKDTGLIATRDYDISLKSVYRIAKTSDGGINWVTTYIDSTESGSSGPINDIDFSNGLSGYAVSNTGEVYSTNNGGNSWSTFQLKNIISINDIWLSKNSPIGYFTGAIKDSLGNSGTIHKTNDGGKTWIQNYRGFVTSISMLTDATGYAIYSGAILKTTNGGIASINNISANKDKFFIYPNPSSGNFNISFDKIESIFIYDCLGKLVYSRLHLQNYLTNQFDISDMPEGIYYIKILQNGKIYTQAIFKR